MAAIVQQTNEANPAVLQVPGVENWVKSVLASARKWTAGRRSQDDICAVPPYKHAVRGRRRVEKLVIEGDFRRRPAQRLRGGAVGSIQFR